MMRRRGRRGRYKARAAARATLNMLASALLLALVAAAHARPDATPAPALPDTLNNTTTGGASNDTAPASAEDAVHRSFPHAALFGRTCGGTIIGASWVLTAGHCTLFTSGRHVLAGTGRSDDGSGTQVRVKKLHLHPRFSVGPYWLNADKFNIKQVAARWDFMLAELESPLPLDGVNIAAVALADDATAELPVGYAGFGAEYHGGLMRPNMHARELRTLPDARCAELEQYDPQDMLCAVGRTPAGDSACNGDSGSGLVSQAPGAPPRLVGVASWVEDDAHECRAGARVYFSRVAAARDWIKKVSGI